MPVEASERPPSTLPRGLGRQGEELFRQLIDSAPDAMVVMSKGGVIELVNRQTERLFGYQRAELVDQLIEILIPERFRTTHVGHRSGFVGAPKTRPMGSGLELFGRRKDATEFPIEISLSPLETREGLWVSAAIRDITDRRQTEGIARRADMEHEAELNRARALAEMANSAKSEFLSSMSHELRTPLNSILGFTQLLQRDKKTPLTERQREMLDHVLRGGEHLLRLIDDILDLSSVEAGRVIVSCEPVGVFAVLADVNASLAPMATRLGVELVLEPAPERELQVLADRTRISQALINFASNALKYGKPGGRATFAVCQPRQGFVRISVVDNGYGIPLDKQDKIFQPLQRAGQEAGPIEGTGIGLAISRRLAELMSGSVGFLSRPGEGSEFWIELPIHESPPVPASKPARAPPAAALAIGVPGQRYLVVYIEDNSSNVAFMRGLLEDIERVTLVCIPTAEVGIEVVRARHPDLVLMDINLPGMSGHDAARRLREWPETTDIPVVALTAAAMAGDHQRVAEAGFRHYLTKPVRVDEMLKLFDRLLPVKGPA